MSAGIIIEVVICDFGTFLGGQQTTKNQLRHPKRNFGERLRHVFLKLASGRFLIGFWEAFERIFAGLKGIERDLG